MGTYTDRGTRRPRSATERLLEMHFAPGIHRLDHGFERRTLLGQGVLDPERFLAYDRSIHQVVVFQILETVRYWRLSRSRL